MFSFTRRAVDELEERVARLERGLKRLEIEWTETLETLKNRLAKMVRTKNRMEELEGSPDAAQEGQEVVPAPPTLDPISERILARRRRLAAHRGEEVEQ